MKKSFLFAAVIAMVAMVATSCKKLKADFDYVPDGLTIQFTNKSVDADSFAWEFGDGETSTEKNPTHKYEAEGSYTVKLTASNSKGSDTKTLPITVEAGEGSYEKLISVSDNSIADWNNLPSNYVFSAECPESAGLTGLKSVKVYADEQYIFILVEPVVEDLGELSWIPFHVYLNTDNSDETGGYGDEFADPNADVLIEGSLYSEGNPIPWGPSVSKWWGEVGASGWTWQDPSVEHSAEDKWGAIIGEGELAGTTSQFVDGKFEIEILREMVPSEAGWNEDAFGIGFDIQSAAWSTVGLLPQVEPTDDNASGLTNKITITIKK